MAASDATGGKLALDHRLSFLSFLKVDFMEQQHLPRLPGVRCSLQPIRARVITSSGVGGGAYDDLNRFELYLDRSGLQPSPRDVYSQLFDESSAGN